MGFPRKQTQRGNKFLYRCSGLVVTASAGGWGFDQSLKVIAVASSLATQDYGNSTTTVPLVSG